MNIPKVSAETKDKIKRKSAWSLPNNPTEAGYKPQSIRDAFYKPIVDMSNSVLSEIDRVINELNEVLDIAVDKIQTVIEGVYTGAEFTYYKSGNNFVITGYIGTETRITFPFEVIYEGQRYPVTTINALGVTPLKEVTIPYEITTIGINAFKDSTLDSVRLARLYTLPTGAFKLSSITKYHVPAEHSTEYRVSLASYITSQLQVVSYDTIAYNKSQIDALFTKITTDIGTHNSSTLAHEYIRTLIATVQTNLNNHNTSEEAHGYIQNLISAAQAAVQGNLDTHKASSTDHPDIRTAITDLGTAQTNALNAHNTSPASHTNLLNRLSAVEAVASGKASVWIFENSTDLFDYLSCTGTARANYGYDSTKWKSGDRILVVGGLEYTEGDEGQVLTGLGAEYWYREDFDPDQRLDAFGNDLRLFEPQENTYTGYLEPNNTSDLLQILDLSLQASASAELAEGYAQDALISAQTSREYAEGKDLNGVPVPALAENNAKYFKEQAQAIAEQMAATIKGDKGDKGDTGDKGDKGDEPVKGVDYWTESDKMEIIQAVVDIMGGALIGYVDENNNIILVGGLEGETYTVKYKMENESLIDIGELDLVEKHSVTNNLTNCTNSNDSEEIVDGNSYSAIITANEDYVLTSVTVIMGGANITSTAVSGGTINIASVTGDIVITAVAEEIVNLATPDATATGQTAWDSGGWCNNSYMAGTSYEYRAATDGRITTNTIAVEHGDTIYVKGINYASATYPQLAILNASGTYIKHGYVAIMSTSQGYIADLVATVGEDYWYFTNALRDGGGDNNGRFIRIAGYPSGDISDIIITRNQPIG